MLSFNPKLGIEDNEKQDVATVLFKLRTHRKDHICLQEVLPGLKIKNLVVVKPTSSDIISLRSQVTKPADVVQHLNQNQPAVAFCNGKSASFADSFIVLKLVSAISWLDRELDSVILLLQSKRKETPKERRATDSEFRANLEKALLAHNGVFQQKFNMLPIFVYITDATNIALPSVDVDLQQCVIVNAAKHIQFYGAYRKTLRDLRNREDDEPSAIKKKEHENKQRRDRHQALKDKEADPKVINAVLESSGNEQSLLKFTVHQLKAVCQHQQIPFGPKDTKAQLAKKIHAAVVKDNALQPPAKKSKKTTTTSVIVPKNKQQATPSKKKKSLRKK